jgi:hypothetical protein
MSGMQAQSPKTIHQEIQLGLHMSKSIHKPPPEFHEVPATVEFRRKASFKNPPYPKATERLADREGYPGPGTAMPKPIEDQ